MGPYIRFIYGYLKGVDPIYINIHIYSYKYRRNKHSRFWILMVSGIYLLTYLKPYKYGPNIMCIFAYLVSICKVVPT